MAIISLNTSSNCLKKTTTLEIIVPDIVRMDKPMSKRKTLYLLHGLSDDGSMWLRRTMIENYAEKYGIVVVMPSADRSFYLD
ncbi:MAG: esterase family protein, partial [Clostridia bacterium]